MAYPISISRSFPDAWNVMPLISKPFLRLSTISIGRVRCSESLVRSVTVPGKHMWKQNGYIRQEVSSTRQNSRGRGKSICVHCAMQDQGILAHPHFPSFPEQT